MGSDDFIQPDDDTSSCDSESSILYFRYILPIGGCISLLCYAYLLWMYFILKSPVLKRHPTTLAIYRCLFEIVFVQQYVWIPLKHTGYFYQHFHSNNGNYQYNDCQASHGAAGFAFLSQFSMLGGELCFLIISMDLRMAYKNPFSTFKQNRMYYAAIVLGGSIFSACMLMMMGNQVYGLASEGCVWIQDRRHRYSIPIAKFLLYYIEIICIFVYCIWANFQFYVNDNRGLGKTLNNRLTIMQRAKRFTLAYICSDLLTLGLEGIAFIDSTEHTLRGLSSYMYSLKGAIAIAIIFYSNWSDITWENMNPFRLSLPRSHIVDIAAREGLQLQPHLNTALRAEILYFTTQGIMCAAREYAAVSGTTLQPQDDRMFSFDEGPNGSYVRESSVGGPASGFIERISMSLKSGVIGGGGGGGTSVRSSHAAEVPFESNTLLQSEIDRLAKEQDMAVTSLYEDAYQEEIERMVGMMSNSASFAHPGAAAAAAAASSSYGGHSSGSTSAKRAAGSQSYIDSSLSASLLSGFSRQGTLVDGNGISSLNEVAMVGRESFSDRGSGVVNNPILHAPPPPRRLESTDERLGSESTASTEKWRDTMDIEFQMDQKNGGNIGNKDESSWHRTKPDGASVPRTMSSTSNSSTSEIIKQTLNLAVFNAKKAARSVFSETQNREFRFKDFCPKLFAKVRDMCNIQSEAYARSFVTTCKERFSEGRSGAFMFFSSDQRCVVKSLTPSEMKSLRKILPDYVEYLRNNPDSLLVRILGAHCITMYGVELNFVVMLNFFPVNPLSERYDLKGSWVGRHGFQGNRSTRSARMKRAVVNASPLFLDNDLQQKISLEPSVTDLLVEQIRMDSKFLRFHNLMDYSLLIGVKRERFEVLARKENEATLNEKRLSTGAALARESLAVEMLDKRRSSLLQPHTSEIKRMSNPRISTGFVDSSPNISSSALSESSIPFGVAVNSIAPLMNRSEQQHGRANQASDSHEWRIYSKENYVELHRDPDGGLKARVVEGPGTYYIGIIDILQEWNWFKKLEYYFKSYITRSDPAGISAVEPNYYADRFWRRCVLDTFEGLPEEDEPRDTSALMSFASHTPFASENDSSREGMGRDTINTAGGTDSSNGASYGENDSTRYAQVIR